MNHTPEPWVVGTNFGCIHKGLPDGRRINGALVICQGNNDQANANARRIVACVNACAGIPTETLEDTKLFIEFFKERLCP